jgi:hypothetical protein
MHTLPKIAFNLPQICENEFGSVKKIFLRLSENLLHFIRLSAPFRCTQKTASKQSHDTAT